MLLASCSLAFWTFRALSDHSFDPISQVKNVPLQCKLKFSLLSGTWSFDLPVPEHSPCALGTARAGSAYGHGILQPNTYGALYRPPRKPPWSSALGTQGNEPSSRHLPATNPHPEPFQLIRDTVCQQDRDLMPALFRRMNYTLFSQTSTQNRSKCIPKSNSPHPLENSLHQGKMDNLFLYVQMWSQLHFVKLFLWIH